MNTKLYIQCSPFIPDNDGVAFCPGLPVKLAFSALMKFEESTITNKIDTFSLEGGYKRIISEEELLILKLKFDLRPTGSHGQCFGLSSESRHKPEVLIKFFEALNSLRP